MLGAQKILRKLCCTPIIACNDSSVPITRRPVPYRTGETTPHKNARDASHRRLECEPTGNAEKRANPANRT